MDRDHSQFEVRCGRVAARALDDAEATPLMEDVLINPTSQKTRNGSRMVNCTGTPFRFDVFPDTGCYQSLISEDLVRMYGMGLDRTRTKRIRAVDGNCMKCSGSVSFEATYGTRTTHILALVTRTLQKEVLLSWKALQRLGVIPEEFLMCPSPVVDSKKLSLSNIV